MHIIMTLNPHRLCEFPSTHLPGGLVLLRQSEINSILAHCEGIKAEAVVKFHTVFAAVCTGKIMMMYGRLDKPTSVLLQNVCFDFRVCVPLYCD